MAQVRNNSTQSKPNSHFCEFVPSLRPAVLSPRLGLVWNVIENGMKGNGNFGMKYGRCQNGMEWKISRMEWNGRFQEWNGRQSSLLHTNSTLISIMAFTEKYVRRVTTKNIRKRLVANHLSTN